MVILGIFFLFLGAISTWIVNDHMALGNQSIDMDAVGLIFMLLGALSVLLGIVWMALATNTSHRAEHDISVDTVPDEKPAIVKRKPRKKTV